MTPFAPTLAALIGLMISFVLPLLVGLVTKASWPAALKAVLLLALQAITQGIVAWQAAGADVDWRGYVYAVLLGFVMSVAAHFGLWKPTGLADVAQMTLVNDGMSDDAPMRLRR